MGCTRVGPGPWRGETAVFDVGMGIQPECRDLAGRMFDHALPELRRRGANWFLLEVSQDKEVCPGIPQAMRA